MYPSWFGLDYGPRSQYSQMGGPQSPFEVTNGCQMTCDEKVSFVARPRPFFTDVLHSTVFTSVKDEWARAELEQRIREFNAGGE